MYLLELTSEQMKIAKDAISAPISKQLSASERSCRLG
jgi:hypothetical protein